MTTARTGAVDAIRLLLDHGASVDAVEGWHQQTALMWASAQDNAAAARALVDRGASLHAVSGGGFTPLLFATREGNLETLDTLLAAGANPNDTLPNGTSALGLATYNAQYEVTARLLEAGADPNASEQGWTALHQVVWDAASEPRTQPTVSGPTRPTRRARHGPHPDRARRRPERAADEGTA